VLPAAAAGKVEPAEIPAVVLKQNGTTFVVDTVEVVMAPYKE